ncbi:MAG TPA: S1/P1 nuclease, partial [Sphingomicrobium sp.]|nr:S1/P1 nuclease [Sphingomicrobium sp.]
ETQYSFTELAAKLERRTSEADVIAWWDINPRDWVSESAQLRETLYPPPAKGKDGAALSYDYAYRFSPVMERRLAQAGVRLAAYLNAIYAQPVAPR